MSPLSFMHLLLTLIVLQLRLGQSLDHTSSGNYQIRNCNAGRPNSQAAELLNLLPQIYDNLVAVIEDAKKGTASDHGYEAFFHNNNNIPYVQSIFTKIAKGVPVPLQNTEGRATNPLMNLGWPTIVCIQPGDPETLGLKSGCDEHPNVPAGTQDNYVVLCPLFWESDKEAESFDCPRVRRNTLTPNDDDLVRNQQAVLVHELVHVYGVVNHLRWQDGNFEKYKLRDAADLDEEQALRNAPNFAYYYSAIQADCTRWPNRKLPHDNLRGLIEVPASSPLTSNPVFPAANATGPLDFNVSSLVPLPASFDLTVGFCNDAVVAPNASLCCNTTSGYWVTTPVLANGNGNETRAGPACPEG